MKPIYEPKGKAKEYGDYAINIYTGCPHQCYYCFAPNVLHIKKEDFHTNVAPRKNIVEEVKKQIEREGITGKLIHLCFTCDPYPYGYDSSPTREIIKILKSTGNHVQILTKNGKDAQRDFDLLDENDWFGVTYAGYPDKDSGLGPEPEPGAGSPVDRLIAIFNAHSKGIKTWVSAEPVLDANDVLVKLCSPALPVDLLKIGKLNYHHSDIDWKWFGDRAEALCREIDRDYYIKESLREEMNKERSDIKVVVWKWDYGVYMPFCPYCDEPAYEKVGCVFCKKPYKYVEGEVKDTVVSKGEYTVVQCSNNHLQLYKNNELILTAACTEKMSEEKLFEYIDRYIQLNSNL